MQRQTRLALIGIEEWAKGETVIDLESGISVQGMANLLAWWEQRAFFLLLYRAWHVELP